MRDLLILLWCCFLHAVVVPQVFGKHHNHHHNNKNHIIRKRSALHRKSIIRAPVNSLVDDVSDSTEFRDRARKLRLISELGEMYPLHTQHQLTMKELAKRKTISRAQKNKRRITKKSHGDDEIAQRKFKIEKDEDDSDAEDQKKSDDDDDDDESGSGDDEDEKNEDADSEDEEKPVKQAKKQLSCHRRCRAPLTFHQCAFPRCSEKLGTIKDLCFFLCKHQKEKCEEICE